MSGVALGLSGGIDSALVALLCLRAGVTVNAVNMPCHSSNSAYDRADQFARDFGIVMHRVSLTVAHEIITAQFRDQGVPVTPGAEADLRSCLRAPTLSALAHATRSLIVGTGILHRRQEILG